MDGLAATRAIKALAGEAGEVPIIAMSADALPQQVERCYAAGMVDHVAKPVQREVLYAKINGGCAENRPRFSYKIRSGPAKAGTQIPHDSGEG
jgi:CheY-like chemotaxis protein